MCLSFKRRADTGRHQRLPAAASPQNLIVPSANQLPGSLRFYPLIAMCVLLGFYLATLAPTVTTVYGGADGGELATAVALGAVPHPPGYPTYLLLGRVALIVPFGEAAWRLGLLSAISTALAALLLARTIAHLPGIITLRPLAGSIAALLFGLDRRVWEQALIVEVYALALLWLSLLLWLTARWWRWHHPPTAAATGLLLGAGLGIQLPLAAWLVGASLVWLDRGIRSRHTKTLRLFTLGGTMLLLGLSVYAVLPWRGATTPQASWGDWSSVDGALAHITAREYAYLVYAIPWAEWPGRISYALGDLLRGLGWVGSGLALLGLTMAGAELRRWRLLSAGTVGATLLWAISYGGADSLVYLLPLHLIAAFWAGVGALVALTWLTLHRPLLARWALLVPLLLCALALRQVDSISLRGATADRDLALARIGSAPPAATLVTQDDAETFPLWYVQQVLGVRPDVRIVDIRLCEQAWYRHRCP